MSNKTVFLIILVILLGGCAGLETQGKKGRGDVILSVPFFLQDAYQCGPVSLAEVFNFWGSEVDPQEIARDIFKARLNGTLSMDMLLYPRRAGFSAATYKGGVEDIRDKIQKGYPLIVLVDFGFYVIEKNHFMVIVGYNNDGIFAHSGKEKEKFFTYSELQRIWGKTDYWTLLIKP
ncbi:MAG: C39 family peptidase [Nitrospirota bacterium]|nr:C39 family peptidase [Nitrospirota bacterium]